VKFFDFDLDGDPDLIVCNGHPDDLVEKISSTLTYREPLLLFHNRDGKFVSVGPGAGDAFSQNYPARGLAVGDLNNDGYPDVVIANSGAPPVILRNKGTSNHWLGLNLKGLASGVIITWSAAGRERSRLKTAGGSYLSAGDPRELLGLGDATKVDWLEVRWPKPNARMDRFENVPAGRYYTLKAGGRLE
jgi:enediyne biosynthesis protein E4